MISKALVKEVCKEAAKLRENATSRELNKLAFSSLNPQSPERCVYGQMTGGCYSPRAEELIRRCASLVIDAGNALSNVSCKWERGRKKELHESNVWSPIEVYIVQDGADNKTLIRYLKGKLETLDLSHTVNC